MTRLARSSNVRCCASMSSTPVTRSGVSSNFRIMLPPLAGVPSRCGWKTVRPAFGQKQIPYRRNGATPARQPITFRRRSDGTAGFSGVGHPTVSAAGSMGGASDMRSPTCGHVRSGQWSVSRVWCGRCGVCMTTKQRDHRTNGGQTVHRACVLLRAVFVQLRRTFRRRGCGPGAPGRGVDIRPRPW